MSQKFSQFLWRSLLIFPIVGFVSLSGITQLDSPQMIAETPQLPSPLETAVIETIQRPGLPTPKVTKVTMQGLFALATWEMGDAGGMVALINNGRNWEVIRLPGGVPDAPELNRLSGIPVDVCQELLAEHLMNSKSNP